MELLRDRVALAAELNCGYVLADVSDVDSAHAHRFDRIRINGLDIGWTDTEGEDATQRTFHAADDGWRERAAKDLPMGKLGQVDEIADFVVLLLSARSGVVTGSVIDWDQNVTGGRD